MNWLKQNWFKMLIIVASYMTLFELNHYEPEWSDIIFLIIILFCLASIILSFKPAIFDNFKNEFRTKHSLLSATTSMVFYVFKWFLIVYSVIFFTVTIIDKVLY